MTTSTAAWLAELASEQVYRDGAVLLGTSVTGEPVHYVLHDRQQVRHGLIVGGRGAGTTGAVRTVIRAVRRDTVVGPIDAAHTGQRRYHPVVFRLVGAADLAPAGRIHRKNGWAR